jgi:hypothetical membrane protein
MKDKINNFKKLILLGILSPILYFLASFIGGASNSGYSHIKDSVSDLLIKGSPNLLILDILMILSNTLLIVSCLAIVFIHGKTIKKTTTAGVVFIGLSGLFSFFSAIIFRLDPHNQGMTFNTAMHISFVSLAALSTIIAGMFIGFSMHKVPGWKNFRLYTMLSFLVLLIGGGISPLLIANNIEIAGLVERISILAYNQWFIVLAYKFYKMK